jgi:hypothetical protein
MNKAEEIKKIVEECKFANFGEWIDNHLKPEFIASHGQEVRVTGAMLGSFSVGFDEVADKLREYGFKARVVNISDNVFSSWALYVALPED